MSGHKHHFQVRTLAFLPAALPAAGSKMLRHTPRLTAGSITSDWLFKEFGASLGSCKPPALRVPLRTPHPAQPKPLPQDQAYVVWPSWEVRGYMLSVCGPPGK